MRLPGSPAGDVGGACSPCTGRGLASRPCRQGRWWALTPPFHPYRRRLRRTRRRRSVFCATFRRLSPPPSRERPALRCPDFPRTLLARRPRSPGLRAEFYLEYVRFDTTPEGHLALGAVHRGSVVKYELAAHLALERRPPQESEQLVLERPVHG